MKGWNMKFIVIALTSMISFSIQASSNLHPIILVPGFGASQLEARLTSEYKPKISECKMYPVQKEKQGWFRLWFDLTGLLEPFTQCFIDRMTLYYDPNLDDYQNAPGVETRVSHFGSTQNLLYVDPKLKNLTQYMEPLVDSLEELGYVDGATLFGAPYDYRYGLAAEGHPTRVGSKYLQDLKHLIEKASSSNQGKPVILIGHSLGGLYVLQFLKRNNPSWRQKYIKHFIALAAPWGGAAYVMHGFASGNSLVVPLVEPLRLRNEIRSSQSNLWLMPRSKTFGNEKPVVITPKATYYAHDIVQFLGDIGFPEGIYPYKTGILPLVEDLEAPNVPITCIVGSGLRTPEMYIYGKEGFDKQPEIVYGDGDGMINMVSLVALVDEWANEKNQSLKLVKLEGVSHRDLVRQRVALDEIIAEIGRINNGIQSLAAA